MDSPERNYSWSAEYRSLRRTRNVKRERETKIEGGEREKTRRERERNEGEGWKEAARWADGATKITENPRRLRATWFVPCVSSTRSSSSTLLLVYSCVPRPPLPFHLRLFRLFIIEHLVIHYISHGPLFFFLQSCRFLPYRGTSRHNHGESLPLPPFQTTAGDHERERERGRESFSPSLSRLFVCSSSVILVISLAMILLSVRFSESLKRGWRHFSYELSMIFDRGYWIRFLYLLSQWREKVGNSKEWFYGEREREIYKQG